MEMYKNNNPLVLDEASAHFINSVLGTPPESIERICAGGNNALYKIKKCANNWYVAKIYFTDANDTRNRLFHDFKFTQYIWLSGIRRVPEPIACSCQHNIAIFKYIDGYKLDIRSVTKGDIDQAIKFITDINRNKYSERGSLLPKASEACFSLKEHLALVNSRILAINNLNLEENLLENEFLALRNELNYWWIKISRSIAYTLKTQEPVFEAISEQDRLLSPSDFGFHNTLTCKNRRKLIFYDFEYSGWDDPAKLMCDFSNQPDMLLPDNLSELFNQAIINNNPQSARLIHRYHFLLPILQVKWVCIILNIFRNTGIKRFQHVWKKDEIEVLMEKQLLKGWTMLKRAQKSFKNIL